MTFGSLSAQQDGAHPQAVATHPMPQTLGSKGKAPKPGFSPKMAFFSWFSDSIGSLPQSEICWSQGPTYNFFRTSPNSACGAPRGQLKSPQACGQPRPRASRRQRAHGVQQPSPCHTVSGRRGPAGLSVLRDTTQFYSSSWLSGSE